MQDFQSRDPSAEEDIDLCAQNQVEEGELGDNDNQFLMKVSQRYWIVFGGTQKNDAYENNIHSDVYEDDNVDVGDDTGLLALEGFGGVTEGGGDLV